MSLATQYQQFIHQSRYARWLDESNRRETWDETVDRYVEFMKTKSAKAVSDQEWQEIRKLIVNADIVPSMRAMMTAGPALERENVAGFNCSFLAVDSLRAFDETLYILMCGTGVGFSVEAENVSKLPIVNEHFEYSDTVIKVADSKAGWARALRELIALLWAGQIPQWDMSKVRPAGAKLKIFGGRASGPGPLSNLFDYFVSTVTKAAGRKITSLEAHDLICKVAEVVRVGGVRRAALISLSDLNDYEVAIAKSGNWWESQGQRALSNNSSVYRTKPSLTQMIDEWNTMVKSQSGERGIFNREGARKSLPERRKDVGDSFGVNPCLSRRVTLLTDQGLRRIGDLADSTTPFNVYAGDGKFRNAIAWETGVKPVYTITLSNGLSVELTGNHVIEVMGLGSNSTYSAAAEVEVKDLVPGMRIKPFVANELWSGGKHVENAEMYGLMFGDGSRKGNLLEINTSEPEVVSFIQQYAVNSNKNIYTIGKIGEEMRNLGFVFDLLPIRKLPDEVFTWSVDSVRRFIRGWFSANGGAMPKHDRIDLKYTCYESGQKLQMLLSALGYNAYITTNGEKEIEWHNGTYVSKESYDLNICGAVQYRKFQQEIGFMHEHKSLDCHGTATTYSPRLVTVKSVTFKDVEIVYDFSEEITHWGWANGIKVHNCGEVILRSNEFCNLSSVVIRENDNEKSIMNKVKYATILGTLQSSLTNFKYLRKIWKENSEAERLLGVSISGQFGNKLMSGQKGLDTLANFLDKLRLHAIDVNAHYADALGINRSAAISVVKPEGSASQLVNSSSGMHPWFSDYYVRTVRADNKDPLTQMLKDAGVPNEPDVMSVDSTTVFSFPIEAPAGALTRNDLTALQHLEIWKVYKRHWTEHNPSVTINVKEEEWIEVLDWVWKNWDDVVGLSFLPFSDHIYQQAPYQPCSKEEHDELKAKMPVIDWSRLSEYEKEDTTISSGELACTADSCEVVDLK